MARYSQSPKGNFIYGLIGFLTFPFVILRGMLAFLGIFASLGRIIYDDIANPKDTLDEAEHRHRITFDTLTASPSEAVMKDHFALVKDLIDDEDWVSFAELVGEWDSQQKKSPDGQAYSHLALEGMVEAIVGELVQMVCGVASCRPVPEKVLTRFELLTAGNPDLHVLAAITAELHMRQAWFIRGGGYSDTVDDAAWENVDAHYAKAAWLLEVHDPIATRSALLARTKMKLCDHMDPDQALFAVFKAYDDWCQIDPDDLKAHEDVAVKLLPRWYGSMDHLTNALSKATIKGGARAYAAGMLHARRWDEYTLLDLDPDLFSEGIDDLARFRGRDPHCVAALMDEIEGARQNLISISREFQVPADMRKSLRAKAERMNGINRELARAHLTAIVPKAWEDKTRGALYVISTLFQDEMKSGATFAMTQDGLQVSVPEKAVEQDPLPH